MTQNTRCRQFLIRNGWKLDPKCKGGSGAYIKGDQCAVEVQEEEQIVFLDDTGDFLTVPVNYYALIGALLECRQITAAYVSV